MRDRTSQGCAKFADAILHPAPPKVCAREKSALNRTNDKKAGRVQNSGRAADKRL